MVATYRIEEILELDDEEIVLNRPNSMCNLERIENLERIRKNRNEISLIGDGDRTILSNLRSIKYLNSYSCQGVHPFDEQEFKRFLKADTDELNTRYPFEITVIKEFSTDIGFAITSKRLIPTTEDVFHRFWDNQEPNIPYANIPFELGKIRINKENNRAVIVDSRLADSDICINLGVFNGRRSIQVVNSYNNIKINPVRHLETPIRNLCANIRRVLETP